MTNRLPSMLAAAALATTAAAQSAHAVEITKTFDFTASDLVGTTPGPVDPVTGSFTVTFDPAVSVSDQTTGITLNNLNITLGSVIGFTNNPTTNTLVVGGEANTVGGVSASADDFSLAILNPATGPAFKSFDYAQNLGDVYYASTGSVSVPSVASSVPEPATWALMMAGFAAVGLALRSRAKANRPATQTVSNTPAPEVI